MNTHPNDDASSSDRRKYTGKRARPESESTSPATVAIHSPCGACKFLRRKCVHASCIFAPHFSSDQGAARFAAVHKVFGASNVSKLLMHIPPNRRHDAILTICYEAQARLSNPVYGCVSTILALQHQVASLQAELSMVQTQIMNNRSALAIALHTPQQHQHAAAAAMLQPVYSNTSTASNNLTNMSNFSLNFNLIGQPTAPNAQPFHPIAQLSHPPRRQRKGNNGARIQLDLPLT